MEFLTDFVDKKYHRLLNFVAPNLPKTLRGNQKLTSNKILNGPPEISRDTNDSDIYTVREFFFLIAVRLKLSTFEGNKYSAKLYHENNSFAAYLFFYRVTF